MPRRSNHTTAIATSAVNVRCTVLCASAPYAVVGVIMAYDRSVDLVTGIATNTEAGVQLMEKITDLCALNVLDKSALPELRALLFKKLDIEAQANKDSSFELVDRP